MESSSVRPPVAAGSFYPSEPEILSASIKRYLSSTDKLGIENIKGLVVPHAGYMYSGQVAAHAYRQVENLDYECIIIIAPSHSELFDFVSLYNGEAYRTPLGLVQIDEQKAASLVSQCDIIRTSDQGHGNEHSLEVQLPFIQTALSGIKIIPLVMGSQSPDSAHKLGTAVGRTFAEDNILVIASTDLSHYHPYNTALALDRQVEKLIADFDIQRLTDKFFKQDIEMCGLGPTLAAMTAAKELGAANSKILAYKNSGDVAGDRSSVVGYLSAILY